MIADLFVLACGAAGLVGGLHMMSHWPVFHSLVEDSLARFAAYGCVLMGPGAIAIAVDGLTRTVMT